MEMKCPEGTKLAFPMDEYFQNPVIWCEESGPFSGQWFDEDTVMTRIQLEHLIYACRDIRSGNVL